MILTIETKYNIGDIVYLKTDPEQYARLVFALQILPGSNIAYILTLGDFTSSHYAVEISSKINVELKTRS
jgi:hypothetical protein